MILRIVFSVYTLGLIALADLSCTKASKTQTPESTTQTLSSCPLRPGLRPNSRVVAPSQALPHRLSSATFSVKRKPNLPRAFSPDTTLFGVEMEFPVASNLTVKTAHQKFSARVKEKCDQCLGLCHTATGNIVLLRDDAKSPSSITLYVGVDPAVIEVQTTPLTYAQTDSWKNEIQSLVFSTAKELEKEGTVVSSNKERNRWSGHINISWPGLNEIHQLPDPESMNLLLNYFVDVQNFPELGMGVLGGDVRNARPLAFGSPAEQTRLRAVIDRYRAGDFLDLQSLAEALFRVVPESFLGGFDEGRYAPVNLESIVNLDATWGYEKGIRLELRSFFAPLSVDEMLSSYRLINGRLDYLRRSFPASERRVVAFEPPVIDRNYLKNVDVFNHKVQGLLAGLSPAKAATTYIRYLKEAGLDPLRESVYLRDPVVKRAVKNQLECTP